MDPLVAPLPLYDNVIVALYTAYRLISTVPAVILLSTEPDAVLSFLHPTKLHPDLLAAFVELKSILSPDITFTDLYTAFSQ